MSLQPLSKETRKNLAVLVVGFGLLLVIEGMLALVGVSPLASEDPFAGFSNGTPLFLPNITGETTKFSLNPGKSRYFNPQTFVMPKPRGTFRIAAFGGSTTYGRPYLANTAFPAWLAALLENVDPDRDYESVNAGGISYASYRVRRLAEEMAVYDPDLYVLYSGHNEFLEARTFADIKEETPSLRAARQILHRSRLYSLLYRGISPLLHSARPSANPLSEEVHARLEEVGGPELYHRDPAFRRNVIREYRANVEAIVDFCRRRRIPLVLCTLPSNLSGVSPFKSEHGENIPEKTRIEQKRWLAEAQSALGHNDPGKALALTNQAVASDDAYALAHYLRGKALQQLGRPAEALAAYTRAKEEDIVSLRALDAFNGIVRDVSNRNGIPLADVDQRFREVSPGGIPGPSLFTDHVHPTIKGQQLIAWTIAETLTTARLVPVSRKTWDARRDSSMGLLAERYGKISARYRAMGRWGVGRLFYWAGKYPEAYDALREAWATVKDVSEIPQLLGELALARQRPDEAGRLFEQALRIDPANLLARFGRVKAHLARGDGSSALLALSKIPEAETSAPRFLLFRGEANLLLGNPAAALGDLETAAAQAPGVQRFAFSLAQARWAAGDEAGARQAFDHYQELSDAEVSPEAFAAFVQDTQRTLTAKPSMPEGR